MCTYLNLNLKQSRHDPFTSTCCRELLLKYKLWRPIVISLTIILRTHTSIYTHTYTHIHIHTNTYAHIYTHTHAHIHSYTLIQIHAYTHFWGGGLFKFFPNFALIPVTRELARSAIVYLPRSGSGRSIVPEANSLIEGTLPSAKRK